MKKGLSRRNLFKYVGAGGAATVAAACDQKPEKLIPMLVPPTNFEYTPHTAYQYMTTCTECDEGCGMMMTVRENRAQKAEGNPLHPLSQGALCARGQASLQTLYNPHRLSKPTIEGKEISWEEGLKFFAQKIKDSKGKIVFLGRPSIGSDRKFFEDWFKSIGGGEKITFQLLDHQSKRDANNVCFGINNNAEIAFEDAKIIYNFGDDFLETSGSSVENSRRLDKTNSYNGKDKSELVHISPHVSLTGATAERWVPIKPGSETLLVLSLAQIIREQKENYGNLSQILDDFKPELISKKVGINSEKIYELAKNFIKNSPSLAIGGGPSGRTSNQMSLHVALNILNAVSGNINKTIKFPDQQEPENTSHKNIIQLIDDLNKEKISLLIIDDSSDEAGLAVTFLSSASSRSL